MRGLAPSVGVVEREPERESDHASIAAHDDVLLICVNYRKPNETRHFVTKALDQSMKSLRVIVVDNSPFPGEGGVPESASKDPRVATIAAGKNLGYFGGAAAALADYLKTHKMPDWVIVSNPDVYFSSPDVLQRLCDLHRADAPGVIAPSIRTVNKAVEQNPYMRHRPSRIRMHLYRWLFSSYPVDVVWESLSWVKHRTLEMFSKVHPPAAASHPEYIYAPHGSFIALNRSYFERGGNLEYGAFLFGEEIFVAETARKLGLTVLYEPAVAIEHTERSTAAGLWNRDASRFRRQASRFLVRNYF
ncbi:MAG TPA: glycosyltransferase [Candidatus Dormibacteraeota bacterium]